MLLARLAVDHQEQGKGLGKALLKDATLRTMQAAEIAGLKLLLAHARDEAAADFYRKHGCEPVVDDPLKLFLPVPTAVSAHRLVISGALPPPRHAPPRVRAGGVASRGEAAM